MTDISVLSLSALDVQRGRAQMSMPVGSTLTDIVEAAFPDLSEARYSMLRVTVGDWVVDPDLWAVTRPKPGLPVIVRIVAQGGNLRSVLSIVVTIAAIAAGQFYLGPLLAAAAPGLGVTAASAISTAAVAMSGQMTLNALQPPTAGDAKP